MVASEPRRLVLPLCHGLLLADAEAVADPDDSDRVMPHQLVTSARDPEAGAALPQINGGVRLKVTGWSFVPAGDVSAGKQSLFDAVLAWEREHGEAAGWFFDQTAFGNVVVARGMAQESVNAAMEGALAAAKSLGAGPEWRRFLSSAGGPVMPLYDTYGDLVRAERWRAFGEAAGALAVFAVLALVAVFWSGQVAHRPMIPVAVLAVAGMVCAIGRIAGARCSVLVVLLGVPAVLLAVAAWTRWTEPAPPVAAAFPGSPPGAAARA